MEILHMKLQACNEHSFILTCVQTDKYRLYLLAYVNNYTTLKREMGVRGLLTFAKSPYVRASSMVTFSSEANKYYRVYGTSPLLVCDGSALLHKLYSVSFPSIYGGQWIEYRNAVAEFVDRFRSLHVDLLFVFDGKVEEKKKDVWFQRRSSDHERNQKLFDDIRDCGREPDRRKAFVLPATAQYSTALILKSLGVEVVSSFTDADTAVAFYARERRAFGVLTNDSDLLIYKCKCPIYTVSDLQYFELKTYKLSVDRLCHHLNLEQTDMPLLACLTGNDRIPSHMLDRFHHRIHNPVQGLSRQECLIVSVAAYITECKMESKTLIDIANEVFHNHSKNIMRMFLQALAQYVLPPDVMPWLREVPPLGPGNWAGFPEVSPWKQAILPPGFLDLTDTKSELIDRNVLIKVIELHTTSDIPPSVLSIIMHNHYECSSSMEDAKQEDIPPIKAMYQSLRQRIYGLLLGSNTHKDELTVIEWHGDKTHSDGVCEERISATKFSTEEGETVLADLWLLPSNPWSHDLRMRTFFTCCLCQDMIHMMPQLSAIPPHFTILCLLLHFLFYKVREKSFLKSQEVDAFIAQAISPLRRDVKQIRDVRVMPRPKSVNLASVFVRGIAVFGLVNAACGSPLPPGAFSPVYLFDGVLFQKKYMQTLHGINADILCDKNPDTKDMFFRLKHMIYT